MQGQVEKSAVVCYESVYHSIKKFPQDEWGKIARLIIRYGTSGKIEELSEEYRIALQPIFDGIDTEKRRYQNVQFLQKMINGIKKKAISIPKTNENNKENSMYQAIENFIKILQRMIVDCRAHDRLTEHVETDVKNLINGDPTIRKCLGFKEMTKEELLMCAKVWSAKYVGVQNYFDTEK